MLVQRTMEPIAQALAYLLAERQMSQADLWATAELSPAVISRYLNGLRGTRMNSQAAETIEKIAAALELAPDYFVEYRMWRVQEIARTFPALVDEVYDLLVAHAAAEEERQSKRRSSAE